jgi:hypothetical protein
MTTLRPNWPSGLPSPEALQAATDAMRRQYVLAGTVLHPAIVGQAIELAYLIGAFGLVSTEPHDAAVQSCATLDTPWHLPRAARFRSRSVLLDAAADTMR